MMEIDLEQQPSIENYQGDNETGDGNGAALSKSVEYGKENLEPYDGREFESKEEAFSFYKEYAKSVGFDTITKASRRSRISGKFIDAKFVCTRYGTPQESTSGILATDTNADHIAENAIIKKKRGRMSRSLLKTDCKACMHVKRREDGRWVVLTFIKEHNHDILPNQAFYSTTRRNVDVGSKNLDSLSSRRERSKKAYEATSRPSGGGKKIRNQSSGISSNNQKQLPLEEEDSEAMLEHFICMQEENPNFFYALDLNEEQRLRNVLWVDAKGRLDYENFDDVVFFDTMNVKNGYKLPVAPFIGVNHHCQYMLLGCALIADDSQSTYSWVMKAWLRAMGQRAPKVILTDQDKALKEVIAETFPDSRHCFCLWHVLSKVPEKLSFVLRQNENFMNKFNKCIFKSYTVEEFEKLWYKMVNRFDLQSNAWLQSLYEDRERWASVYMRDIFLAGMSTRQRPESIKNMFDTCMQRITTLKEFFYQYKAILLGRSEEEKVANFNMWHKQPGLRSPSPFEKQMANLYTNAIFKKFQAEVLGVVACHPKKESKEGATTIFTVQDFDDNQYFTVAFNEIKSEISCTCRLFEYNGFLCRHVLIVLQMSGAHTIPSQYILKRWTKEAKIRQTKRQELQMVASRVQRYNDICKLAFKLGDEGLLCEESYNIACNALEESLIRCENMNSLAHSVDVCEEGCEGNIISNSDRSSVSKRVQEHSTLQATTFDCSYQSQESMQQMEQLNSSVAALAGYYYGPQPIVQGMLNIMTPSCDGAYSNQQNLQRLLGHPNSVGAAHDGHYLTQPQFLGLGDLNVRPQTSQSCSNMQNTYQDMDQSESQKGNNQISMPGKETL